jgi:hypothetical protein
LGAFYRVSTCPESELREHRSGLPALKTDENLSKIRVNTRFIEFKNITTSTSENTEEYS